MKKLPILFFLYFFMMGAVAISAAFPINNFRNRPVLSPAANGAANVTELATGLLQALQANNFDQITTYLPGEAELALIKRRSSADMKAVVQELSLADYRSNLKAEYQALVQQGISNTLNWTDMQVVEAQVGKGTRKNQLLQPVLAILQNKQNQQVQVAFEVIKLNRRYYLFQRMQLKP